MRHTLRLNSLGGFVLFSGDKLKGYKSFDIDVISNGISHNYLLAQKRIDDLLDAGVPGWHFCVANLFNGERPVVVYGRSFPLINDDKGRPGIRFIHAVEVDAIQQIYSAVIGIIKLLSNQMIPKIDDVMTRLTDGTMTPQEAIGFFTNEFTKHHHQFNKSSKISNSPIKEIQHDCGGASSVAWLAMTISHMSESSSYEIYETYNHEQGMKSTVSSCADASKKHVLSEYLYQIIDDYELLENPSALPSEHMKKNLSDGVVEELPSVQRRPSDPINQDASLGSGQVHSQTKGEKSNKARNFSSNQRYANASFFSEYQSEHFPNSHIVRFDGLFANELSLLGDNLTYRIDKNNCIYIKNKGSYYEFIIAKSKWFGLAQKEISLVLPKDNLTEQQSADIYRFYQNISLGDR